MNRPDDEKEKAYWKIALEGGGGNRNSGQDKFKKGKKAKRDSGQLDHRALPDVSSIPPTNRTIQNVEASVTELFADKLRPDEAAFLKAFQAGNSLTLLTELLQAKPDKTVEEIQALLLSLLGYQDISAQAGGNRLVISPLEIPGVIQDTALAGVADGIVFDSHRGSTQITKFYKTIQPNRTRQASYPRAEREQRAHRERRFEHEIWEMFHAPQLRSPIDALLAQHDFPPLEDIEGVRSTTNRLHYYTLREERVFAPPYIQASELPLRRNSFEKLSETYINSLQNPGE